MQKAIPVLLFVLLIQASTPVCSQILIDAASLQRKIEQKDLVILQVGRDEAYAEEHIPGAQFIAGDEFTIQEEDRYFDLPDVEDLVKNFEAKGISNSSRIVIYTEANWIPSTTRLFFTFDYLGLRTQVSILDGGLIAWKAAGGKTTKEKPEIEKGTLTVTPRDDLVVEKKYIKSSLGNNNVNIIDCRAAAYYQGIDVSTMHGNRKGRIPGAKSIPYTTLYDKTDHGSYEFKTTAEIKDILEKQELSKNDEIILYCHIGYQLTVVYTATQLLGYTNVKVYDGSFHEWGFDQSMPVEE